MGSFHSTRSSLVPAEPTRLSAYLNGLLEAIWLTALVVTPLFFNPQASAPFEPSKAVLIQGLAWIAVAAVLLRFWESGQSWGSVGKKLKTTPFRVVLGAWALFLAANVIATALSVDPWISFWGSLEHAQGLPTLVAEIVLGGIVATSLRTKAQAHRLVTTILAASLPLAGYALLQKAGWDPITFDDAEGRVFSRSGHPIALAAYLLMVLPLTGWRLWQALSWKATELGGRRWKIASIFFYSLLGLIQLLAFVWTESRGPLLGLVATVAFIAVGWGAYRNRWRGLGLTVIFVGVGLCFLAILNQPQGPLASWAAQPTWSRWAHALPVHSGPEDIRAEFWRQAVQLIFSSEPRPWPQGGVDQLHGTRWLIGYGPETLQKVWPHSYTLPGAMTRLENRFHNRVWDLWYGIGFLGLSAFLGLVLLLFFHGYQHLGWLPTKRAKTFFWVWLALGAGFGLAVLNTWGGVGFTGLGLLTGLVGGVVTYPGMARLRRFTSTDDQTMGPEGTLLVIVLLAALAGHLVETGFAFSVADTAVQFWVYAGFLLALIRTSLWSVTEEESNSPASEEERGPMGVAAWAATLILMTLLFGFIHLYSPESLSGGEVLRRTLTQIKGDRGPSFLLWLLLIPTWAAVNFLFIVSVPRKNKSKDFFRWWGGSLLISGLTIGAYALGKAQQVTAQGPIPFSESTGELMALEQLSGYAGIYGVFVVLLLGLLFLGGWIFSPAMARGLGRSRLNLFWVAAAFVLALGAASWMNEGVLRANMAMGWAKVLLGAQRIEASVAVYRRAVELEPRSVPARRCLADALLQWAENESEGGLFQARFREAETYLTAAQTFSRGLDEATYDLGRLYLRWAAEEGPGEQRSMLARQAAEFLDRALIFQPGAEWVWVDRALLDQLFLGRPEEAAKKMAQADILIRGDTPVVWGDAYRERSVNALQPEIAQFYARRAMAHYQRGVDENKLDRGLLARCLVHKGGLQLSLREWDSATATLLQALEQAPPEEAWPAEIMLAQIYVQQGQKELALRYVTTAIEKAPLEKKLSLIELQQQIMAH